MSTLDAATAHLKMLRNDPVQAPLYVGLAYKYGVEVDQIVEDSGLSLEQVRRLILGGN
jgi:hypothetical protein